MQVLSRLSPATYILDGVRAEQWRILVGADAHALDRLVRASPETAYEESFMAALQAEVLAGGLGPELSL